MEEKDFLSTQKTDQDMVDWFKEIEKNALADIKKQKKQDKKNSKARKNNG